LLTYHRRHFRREIVHFLFDSFAHLITGEAADRNVLFDRTDLLGYELAD